MKEKLLICTFSGGRTSAFMAKFLDSYSKYDEYDKLFIFANTGRERPETLEFIKQCEDHWNMNIVWVEAKVIDKRGTPTSFNLVDYDTASRNGEPFEDMLKVYPMPNNFVSNCTRELKQRPITAYVKSLGYKDTLMAMGIRADESHRRSIHATTDKIIYPLIDDIKVDSNFIRTWWDKQDFDLQLKDYQGNCDLCFKKSLRKKLTIIKENPKVADWWIRTEKNYRTDEYPMYDLRNKKMVFELVELAKQPFKTIHDLHELNKQQMTLFDVIMDMETDCYCKGT